MRIGYSIDTFVGEATQPVPDPRTAASVMEAMIDEAVAAERAGFHSVRVPDRHGRTDCYIPGALQLLTIIAHETSRVALGAFALVNTLYNPMLIAEQSAVIDNLSRGRLFMSWARGKDYWNYFGIPPERMLGRFLENVRVIEQAFAGERFSHHGDFYDVDDALLSPQPYQQPRFPFWGAGQTAAAITRCAEYAEAWACNDLPFAPERWKPIADAYRDAARERGKVPFVILGRNGWVADTHEQAMEQFGQSYIRDVHAKISQRGVFPGYPEWDDPSKVTSESVSEHLVIGTAAQCIERLEYFEEELSVDYVTIRFRLPTAPSFAETRDQIYRFGEEVVRHFHRSGPAADHPAIPVGARW